MKISPISRDVSNLIPSPSNTSIQDILKTKTLNKTLRKLKQKEQKLQHDITLLTIHQKTLNDESYLNCNNNVINNNIRLSKIADLKQKHSVLLNQLNEIRTQVDTLLQSEKQLNRKDNIKAFLERIENEKETYEAKIHKYEEQSSILQQRRLND
jgi:ABC-type dipeptide/oligopeptide/nickel transport system ATPase component